MSEGYDCRRCGACCIEPFGLPGYVYLDPAEQGRLRRRGLPVIGDELATAPDQAAPERNVCVAFQGTIGDRCRCGIYRIRPRSCREFTPGSFGCRLARRQAGLPPYPEGSDA